MFEVGREYNRKKDIHDRYRGQSQGGISTPKNAPFIFVFTGDAGEQHGYRDEYCEGVFRYTGEGQLGDMSMDGGNRAILDHSRNGKTIHIFEYVRKAYVRYVGEAECLGYEESVAPDREGSPRKVYIFLLDIDSFPVVGEVAEPKNIYGKVVSSSLKGKSTADLREVILTKASEVMSPKERRVFARDRAEVLKEYIRRRAQGVCEGCRCNAPFASKRGPFLECHHVHRMADGGPDHPENVVGLCPNCHRRAHYAIDAKKFNEDLKGRALEAERNFQ